MSRYKNIIIYQAKGYHASLMISVYDQSSSFEACQKERLSWLSAGNDRIMYLFEFARDIPSHLLNQLPQNDLATYGF